MPIPTSYTDTPEARPNPGMPGSTRQAVSSGFIETAFGILGQTIAQDRGDPGFAEPFSKLGTNIANSLRDRWHKQEYENFQAQYVSNYQAAANAISGNLSMQMSSLDRGELIQPDGTITKINPKSEGFMRTRDTIIRQSTDAIHKINDQFLQDAAKFATNPYISQVAESLMGSTAKYVGEATGPTPAMENEAAYTDLAAKNQEISQSKAYERYLDRMPADRAGSGSEKDPKRGDPVALMQELGPDNFMRMLVGSDKGYELTAPYQTTAASMIKQDLLNSDPNLANDEEALATRMGASEQAIQERAAGLYMRTVFPEFADDLSGLEEFRRYFPLKEEQLEEAPVPGAVTKKEQDAHMQIIYEKALDQLELIVRKENPKNIDEAIGKVLKRWFPGFINQYARGKGTERFKKTARNLLVTFLSDPENWGQRDIAREQFGKPKLGVLGRIGETVKSAEEYGRKVEGETKRGLFE